MRRRTGVAVSIASSAIAGVVALNCAQPANAQSATSMDVFGRAYQIFMFVAQNSHRLDTPDGNAAPCRDPWVSSAFRLVFQREPNGSGDTGECNYRNFGGGSWNSYRDLVWKTAWYRAYKELGLVRGGTALDESLSTPEGLKPLVTTAVAEVTGQATVGAPVERGAGYAAIKERVEDVYYSCSNEDISRAIIEVTGRAPRGTENQGECNPLLYNKGKWDNYNDLAGKVRRTLVRDPYKVGQCRDSELTRAITEVKQQRGDANMAPSGMGELGECNMYLYGGGHWSSYADLKTKVASTLTDLAANNIQLLPDNSIKAQRLERGGGSGALMALLAAANAYMQWKAMQPPKEKKNKNNNQMMMQGGMQPGMDPNMMGGMQGGMMQPGMMPQMQPQMQPGMGMIQPGAQMPMMPPQIQQMPMQPGMMQQMPMQGGMMQPGMQPQMQPQMQPGMMPQLPQGM